MHSAQVAAETLMGSLKLPRSAVSAYVWSEGGIFEIRLFADEAYIEQIANIKEFSGFPVRVVPRPEVIAAN
jgi:hypothetical protein